ncbi:MAG TPA: hypothetical protein VKR06_46320 [Ktedonosporobacter sp.]|nr:hypothetical protein [Ktedonosporobacter sp.]
MPRTCTICSHPERSAIEEAVVAGTSFRIIASRFSVGAASVQRHVADHVANSIKQSQTAKEEAQGLDVVKQLKFINTVTLDILAESRSGKEKKNGMALFAIDRVIKQLELQAKLLGDIDTPQVNIMISPEWQTIRGTIIHALTPYPDARVAVAGALATLEGNHARLN